MHNLKDTIEKGLINRIIVALSLLLPVLFFVNAYVVSREVAQKRAEVQSVVAETLRNPVMKNDLVQIRNILSGFTFSFSNYLICVRVGDIQVSSHSCPPENYAPYTSDAVSYTHLTLPTNREV